MTDRPAEQELVAAFVRERDETAFRRLYRRETPVLYRVALRFLGGRPSQAEDAVQETWIRAAERLPDFRFESSLRTWLIGILINCCRESRRRELPAAPPPPDDSIPEGPGAAGRLDLERAVADLADGYRHVLVLHDVMGYTHAEVAMLLGIEEGTSKSQLFLARRALRRRLGLTEEVRHERRG